MTAASIAVIHGDLLESRRTILTQLNKESKNMIIKKYGKVEIEDIDGKSVIRINDFNVKFEGEVEDFEEFAIKWAIDALNKKLKSL